MKWTLGTAALAALLFVNSAQAQELCLDDSVCEDTCCDCMCGVWQADVELTFLRYHRSNGVSSGGLDYDYEFAPRFTVGYGACDGLGVRVRYWEIDDVSDPGRDEVDTYNLDFEVFRAVQVGCDATIEVSAGLRYNDYEELNDDFFGDTTATSFDGIGGIIGIEARHHACWGTLYARGRYAILMDDILADYDVGGFVSHRSGHKVDQQEIAFGIEREICMCGMTATVGAGGEWSNWSDYSALYDSDDDTFAYRDVGFVGFVFSFGLEY